MSMQGDPAASMGATPGVPGTSDEIDGVMDGGADGATTDRDGTDPEALGDEREHYPDPESYPEPELLDGETPDADLQVDDPSGGEERHGRE